MYSFFVSDTEKFFSRKNISYKQSYIGFLFEKNQYLGKKKLYIDNGNIKKFSFLEFEDFSFIEDINYGIYIQDNNCRISKEGTVDNYASIISFYSDNYTPNPIVSINDGKISISENKNSEILKMIYPYGLYESDIEDIDIEKNSDLTDYDQDGTFLYEENNDPMDKLIIDYNGTKI